MKVTKTLNSRHIKLCPVIGFGYWKDDFNLANVRGYTHNIIIPFIRIQWGFIEGGDPIHL